MILEYIKYGVNSCTVWWFESDACLNITFFILQPEFSKSRISFSSFSINLHLLELQRLIIYSSVTVNWISLGCGQNKTFEDIMREIKGRKRIWDYLLAVVQMERRVRFNGPLNISGTSQQNSVAAFSQTTKVDGDLNTLEKHLKIKVLIQLVQTNPYPRKPQCPKMIWKDVI